MQNPSAENFEHINEQAHDPNLWNEMGSSSVAEGDLDTAQICFETLIALLPESAIAWDNLARVYLAQSKQERATAAFKKAMDLDPTYKQARWAYSQIVSVSDPESGLAALIDGLCIDPSCPSTRLYLAEARSTAGEWESAIKDACGVVDSRASDYDQVLKAADLLLEFRRIDLALVGFARAIELDSSRHEAFHGFGVCHHSMGSISVAKEAYETVLKIKPQSHATLKNLAVISALRGNYDVAIDQIKESISLVPGDRASRIQLEFYKRYICDWSQSLAAIDVKQICEQETAVISPFSVLPLIDDPMLQFGLSERWQQSRHPLNKKADLSLKPRSSKVRVGWFGSDFHDHATLFLMRGLFREYDRSKFEFHVFSYGMIKKSPLRAECQKNVDEFFDVSGMTDEEIVRRAREALDIAIDLKGFTNGGRVSLFQERMAPVQVNYLGFPGTAGSNAYDYIIADDIVVPKELEGSFSEAVLRMPHSYQPNDSARPISDKVFTRVTEGLPDGAFVFCSFNNSYKIGPEEFDVWMSLLRDIPDSVLWLLEPNTMVADNLRAEARARGVDSTRLVFARRLPVDEHLARQRLADLFLDSFNVNAHTTASDALWAGLPVVTLPGKQFAARVGASLVSAAGLKQLVAKDVEDYECIARSMAANPARLGALRRGLEADRLTLPLFDTVSYCREFEQLLLRTQV